MNELFEFEVFVALAVRASISVGEIELLCEVFLACLEETLYKLRLIRV